MPFTHTRSIMPRRCLRFLPCMLLATVLHAGPEPVVFPADPTAWPPASSTHKPWTRWWWLGSAVDKPNLTRDLEAFAKAGLGGVEICPIYGAIGAENRFIDFLSPQWMEMLAHTTAEAKRLGLGVDMTTGTGWPFGGPVVTPATASCGLQRITATVDGGKTLSLKLPEGNLQCLRAFPEDGGNAVDLADSAKGGTLEWTAPAGKWTLAGLTAKSGIQDVKRAAPGGHGLVLDPFSAAAMNGYLAAFDRAFADFAGPKPRAQFHDSFEYYGADWTPGFFESFQKARGYDLRSQLPAFNGSGAPDTVARVRADYRQTLGELHHDYLKAWHDWARKHGGITRNQAHGSPGNLLDHYAVSEIPETEIFRHVAEDQIPMLRLAASAAHANGGTLVSSETFTWLGEHFQVTPEQLKEAADFVFLGGVNHLFFHGIPYSPADAPWPGWLFYASTHMGPNGGLWHDLPAFTGYLQRCQSILQEGKPSSEVLLYFPFHDLIHGGAEKLPLFTVHNQNEWLQPTRFHETAMELWNQGVTFDFASDDLLSRASVRDGRIVLGSNSFRALVLPGVKRMPVTTLEILLKLAAQGGAVIVQDGFPTDVPGFHDRESQLAALKSLRESNKSRLRSVSGSVLPALATLGALREPMTASGLRFVRRSHADGHHYFIVNRGQTTFDGLLDLAVPFESAVILDPWSAKPGSVHHGAGVPPAARSGSHGIPLRLAPHQSLVIRTYTTKRIEGPAWIHPPAAAQPVEITGPWKLEFLEGGPALPQAAEMPAPASWTTLSDPAAAVFSGTARYSTTFEFKGREDARVRLDLGKIAHTARILLNDGPAAISWCPPHVLELTGRLKPGRNTLAIEVTNLAANRIADLDRRKVPWKRFHEINFVNIEYKSFDAAEWPPMESGLLGPVRLLVDPGL